MLATFWSPAPAPRVAPGGEMKCLEKNESEEGAAWTESEGIAQTENSFIRIGSEWAGTPEKLYLCRVRLQP